MLIFNDIDILQKYDKVRLLFTETIDCTIRNEFIWLNGCQPIDKLSYDNGAIKLTLLVEGNTEYIGRVIKEMSNGKLQHEETHYNVVTITKYEHKRIIENVYEVTIEYSASFKLYEEVVNPITSTNNIIYEGTVDTPLSIEMISKGTSCGIDVNGVTISFNDIKANDTILIDRNKVFVNGVNGFGKCNIYEFPKMITGENIITVHNCTATIKYNPMFL